MPAPIEKGLLGFLQSQLQINVWDGEIPRQDPGGADIFPNGLPSDWPAVTLELPEEGFERESTFEGVYGEQGTVVVLVFNASNTASDGRYGARLVMGQIERLLALETNWRLILNGVADELGDAVYELFEIYLTRWTCVQQRGDAGADRTENNEIIYRGELHYYIRVHGEVQKRADAQVGKGK